MVSMVESPLCAHVSVHFKNPVFSYFGAYIPHFCVFVIGYIYRVKREYLREFDTDKIHQFVLCGLAYRLMCYRW